jgi:hypothetical protein
MDYEERALKCFEGLELDGLPYNTETFSRKKRDYVKKFNEIAAEVSDVKQFLALMLTSHELFLNLVQVILCSIYWKIP